MTDSNPSGESDAPADVVDAPTAPDPGLGAEPVVVDDLDRVELFGLQMVNAAGLDPVIEELRNGPRRDDAVQPVVLTPNVDIMVHLDEHPDSVEAEMFGRAQYCLPDGQPIVAFSRLVGEPLQARLPGSGLFAELWPRLADDRTPVVVIASSDAVADGLKEEHPKAGFVIPPMFDADDEVAIDAIVTEVLAVARAVRPDMILVGIGNPKDARLIAALFERWDRRLGQKPLCLGLGGSFAMHLGITKRAPNWVQRIGMEWFFRFAQEPRRLFHRYFIRDAAFVGIMKREWQQRRAGNSETNG